MLEETTPSKAELCRKATEVIAGTDPKAIVMEVAKWLAANVESYIDNHETVYNLTFGDVEAEHFPLLNALESAVMAALADPPGYEGKGPDDPGREPPEEEVQMLVALTEKMEAATNVGKQDKSIFSFLFDRLKFYYETIVGLDENGPKLKEVEGHIDLHMFEFDTNAMSVKVVKRVGEDVKDVQVVEMNPSFIVDFTMVYWDKKVEMGLF